MIIVNKEHNDAYNLSNITNFYIGSDGCSVKVSAGSTRGGIMGKYNSYEETKKAFEILFEKIQKDNTPVIYMPNDNDVNTVIKSTPEHKHHHISGNKTKGHGGS